MNIKSTTRIALAVLASLIMLTFHQAEAQEVFRARQQVNVRMIEGLSQRRLFDLATGHAERVLANQSTSGRERIDVIVALIDTLSQKAFQGRDLQYWTDAKKVATDWIQQSQSPRKILILVQAAMVDQLLVEKRVREIETDSAKPGAREQALTLITGLDNEFDSLQQEVRRLLNRRPGPREQAEWFSANELLTLRYNLEYQQARALLHRAALYGKDQQLNRDDVLTRVEKQLTSVLQSVGPDQRLWWMSQADRIAIARDTGDFRKAEVIFKGLPKNGIAPGNQNLIKAEWIRTLTARSELDHAVFIAGKDSIATESPRLDLARVELFVAMAGQDGDRTWQQRSLDLTRSIEESHGGYWGRLANLAVVGAASMNPESGSNIDLLIRVADEAQRKKQWNEAIKALDAAFAKAAETQKPDIAWKLGFRAASIEQTQGQHSVACDRFERLAIRFSDLPQAPTGLLMASWNLTRIMKNDADLRTRYEAMLVRLIETWPLSSSANQARIWLASIKQSQQNWPAAIGLLLDVSTASQLFGKTVVDLRKITRQFMAQSSVSRESKSNIRSALAVRLSPLVEVDAQSMPENWKSTRVQIVLCLAELKFLYGTDIPIELLTLLDYFPQDPTLDSDVRALARALIRTGQIKNGVADAHFSLGPDSKQIEDQLDIFYSAFVSDRLESDGNPLAGSLLKLGRAYESEIDGLPPAKKKAWYLAIMDALVNTNQIDDAVRMATDLANTRYPRDLAVQIRVAQLLTTSAKQDTAVASDALRQWRKIAKASRKNTGTWYKAKYHVARLLSDQGNDEQALKLLRFIRAVPPGWENAENANLFDELFKSLSGDQAFPQEGDRGLEGEVNHVLNCPDIPTQGVNAGLFFHPGILGGRHGLGS